MSETETPGETVTSSEYERQPTTVLFTDLVGSTERALALGDAAWATLLERHDELVRAAVERHRGVEMDTAGDGLFAVFSDPTDAIRSACEIRDELAQLGLEVREGIHHGHCWTAAGKCAGADVHVGARLAEHAEPGEVLVSEEAMRIAARRGITFTYRGAASLKGLPAERRLFAVSGLPVTANVVA